MYWHFSLLFLSCLTREALAIPTLSTSTPTQIQLETSSSSNSVTTSASPSLTVKLEDVTQGVLATTPPPDFGTEIVTATQNGTAFTFTHHIGINLANDAQNNEVIDISAPLLEAVHNLVADTSVCQDPAMTKRQAHNVSVSNLDIRDDPIINDLVVDACFLPRMNAAFGEMDLDLGGALANVLPAVANSVAIRDFISTINVAFELAYARFDADSYYSWAPVESRRLAVGILGVLMILEAQNIHIQNRVILNNRLFQNDPPDPIVCGTDENAPACVETNCHGVDGKCTIKGSEGCECYNILDVPELYPWDSATIDVQQAMLAEAAIGVPGNPKCAGIGSQHTTDRESAANAINTFCGTGNIVRDPSPIVSDYTQQYFSGTDAWLQLRINWADSYGMPSNDCKNFLLTILDGCDGHNPDNPKNLKHGGTIDYQGGPSLELTPLGGSPIHCNNYPFAKWVDAGIAIDAITQFCNDQSLTGHPGTRPEVEYNKGTSTDIMITLSFYGDYTMSVSDCISQFRNTIDNCDHDDDVNNPFDNKYGGTYTNEQGVVFMVTPLTIPSGFPPTNEFEVPTCDNPGTRKNVNTDKLQAATLKFCKDNVDLYSGDFKQGKDTLTLSGVLAPDPASIWPNGSTACRQSALWDGKMKLYDCQYAMQKMAGKCKASVSYNYHCVRWSASQH